MSVRRTAFAAAALAAAAAAAAVLAQDAGPVPFAAKRSAFFSAQARLVDAAIALGSGDSAGAAEAVTSARADLAAADSGPRRLRQAVRRAADSVEAARVRVTALAPGEDDVTGAVAAVRRAARATQALLARIGARGTDGSLELVEEGRGAWIHAPGARVVFRVRGGDGSEPQVTVTNDELARVCVELAVTRLSRGRFRVTWGPDLGAATITASRGESASVRAFCTGAEGVLATTPPSLPDYGVATAFARVGTPLGPVTPAVAGDGPFVFDVVPALPAGVLFDDATGAISGTPAASGPVSIHRVIVRNARATASVELSVDVDPALPEGVESLVGGFAIDAVADELTLPVKMAFAPDGRLFFSELFSGQVRVVDAGGGLRAEPLVTVPVQPGPEQGLLGIAVAPDFAQTGHLFVVATAPAAGPQPVRNRIVRYTVTGNTAADPVVIADDLPVGNMQNGGHLVFGPDGFLYASSGDNGVPELSQEEGSLAGRILRIARDGSVPPGNPIPGSWEWCRGLRNAFGIAFDPASGFLFATENGPMAEDELEFVQPGKNYGWGAPPDAHFGSLTGVRVKTWTPVIVPTGIAIHSGLSFGSAYAGNVFLESYDVAQLRRLVLEGVDLRSETVFAQFSEVGLAQRPLDIVVAPDGSLRVSTFQSIWRIRKD